jgi:hypothetical protein
MISANRRWLGGFVVAIGCLPRVVNAQAVWQPVGPPSHTESGTIAPRETICSGGSPCQVTVWGKGSTHAWLEWSEAAAELKLTVWRDGTPIASSNPIGSLTHYLNVDLRRPEPLEFRITHARGPDPATYRLRIWQDTRLRWSLSGTDGPTVTVGQDIMVVEDGSKPVKERIAEIRPERLVTMDTGQAREISTARITRIHRGDNLRNGALIGLLTGAGIALNRLGSCEINCYGAFVPVFGGIGAGVGTLIDAMRRSTTLYVASNPP